MSKRPFGILIALACATPALAHEGAKPLSWEEDRTFAGALDLTAFRKLAIQEGGRRKPIDSFARETIFKITDRKQFEGIDPVFMILSMVYEGREQWNTRRCVVVSNLKLIDLLTESGKNDLGQPTRRPGSKLYVSLVDFQQSREIQRLYAIASDKHEKKVPRSDLEDAVLDCSQRFFLLTSLDRLFTIIPSSDVVTDKWTTIGGANTALFDSLKKTESRLLESIHKRDAATMNSALAELSAQITAYDFKVYPYFGLIELEYFMNTAKPFQTVQFIYLAAIIAMIAGFFGVAKAELVGFPIFCAAAAIHILALTGRGFLVARSPVATLYETLLFMTGFAALLAVVLETILQRPRWFALGASITGLLGLFLGDVVPAYADHQFISPLVPVLRSYWLNIHVTCMISSYGACLLGAAIASVYLVRYTLSNGAAAKSANMIQMDDYLYRTVQVAFLLLTVGVILGGVWANQSWGRYWDWDPKETWAFITWIVYAAYLHMRVTGLGRGPLGAVMGLVGFWFVMFTYLGVSYVLPGLHSYVPAGKSDTYYLAPFLVAPFIVAGFYRALWMVGKARAQGASGIILDLKAQAASLTK